MFHIFHIFFSLAVQQKLHIKVQLQHTTTNLLLFFRFCNILFSLWQINYSVSISSIFSSTKIFPLIFFSLLPASKKSLNLRYSIYLAEPIKPNSQLRLISGLLIKKNNNHHFRTTQKQIVVNKYRNELFFNHKAKEKDCGRFFLYNIIYELVCG